MGARKSLYIVWCAVAALVACLLDCQCAFAQREPVIVVPGRSGYQVLLWGRDVTGAVLEGEFGLDRPGVVTPTVVPAPGPYPYNVGISPGPSSYFPATGQKPRYGRLEVLPPPNRRLPPPAPSFNRSWTSESPHLPANTDPPLYPPPVILAPQLNPNPARPAPQPTPLPRGP
jgi:hypothetical protein